MLSTAWGIVINSDLYECLFSFIISEIYKISSIRNEQKSRPISKTLMDKYNKGLLNILIKLGTTYTKVGDELAFKVV